MRSARTSHPGAWGPNVSALSIIQELADAETARQLRAAYRWIRLARAQGLLDGLYCMSRLDGLRTPRESRAYWRAYARGQEIREGRVR